MNISFSYNNALSTEAISQYQEAVKSAHNELVQGTGLGNDFLGWIQLPADIRSQLDDIQACANLLRSKCDIIVCIGIGGSYLGAKAVIEALSNSFAWLEGNKPAIVYAGQNICEDYLYELQNLLRDKKFGIISISKSGTTTEPALAFRLLKTQLEAQCGEEFAKE
jgi:glucose-6-phosphate isomerase